MQFHGPSGNAAMPGDRKDRSRIQAFLDRIIKFTDLGRHDLSEYEVHRVYDFAPAPEVFVKLYYPVFISFIAMICLILGKEQIRPCLPEPIYALLNVAHHEYVEYAVLIA